MLYYVKDPEATVSFFRSQLDKDGKLLIILVSGKCSNSKSSKHKSDKAGLGHKALYKDKEHIQNVPC